MSKKTSAKSAKRNEFISRNGHMKLLGEVICWSMGRQEKQQKEVVKCLKGAGLDEKVAREFLPRHAFSRASKKLSEERVIDVLRDEDDTLTFQFTKKVMDDDEWKYTKETLLELNKITGKIKCDNEKLEQLAQNLLDEHMEKRNASDITKIIQKLFESEGDLFPLRDQGGVYFVPEACRGFTDQIDDFMKNLTGHDIIRFPVPAETKHGDRSVKDAVVNGLSNLIKDHETAVESFGLSTRHDTIEQQAERLKETKLKIEAYSSYLQDKKEELDEALQEAQKKLLDKISKLSDERSKSSLVGGEGGGRKDCIFSYPVTAVLRRLSKEGWKFKQLRLLMDHLLGKDEVKDNTIKSQLYYGSVHNVPEKDRTPQQQEIATKPLANLTEDQMDTLKVKLEAAEKKGSK